MAKKINKTNDKAIIKSKEEKQKLLDSINLLRKKNEHLRIENDILEKTSEIIKKEEGINLKDLDNFEKTTVINALREKHFLQKLLKKLNLVKNSYFYQIVKMHKEDKYYELREDIKVIFNNVYKAYGYRRIHLVLKSEVVKVSEKVVRRLMHEEGLIIKKIKKRKYNSYLGEISPAADNLLKRDFSAGHPNKKWSTDLTEFAIPSGKIYLSPIIDCFDGLPVRWTISTSPNAELANGMLEQAITTLSDGENPIVHS